MNVLYYLLCGVEVIVCLLLIGVILLQRSKDGSAAGLGIGGGMGEAIFGAQMGNVLTRATVILGFIFLTNTLILAILSARNEGRSLMDGADVRPVPQSATTVPATLPEIPASATAPDAVPVAVPVDTVVPAAMPDAAEPVADAADAPLENPVAE